MNADKKAEALRRGAERFNRGEFFLCHEVLEEIWLEESKGEKPFYQGLIQVAAGFHHWQRGNRAGALSLIEAGADKLRRFAPTRHGVDLAALLAALAPWLAHLRAESSATAPELPLICLGS